MLLSVCGIYSDESVPGTPEENGLLPRTSTIYFTPGWPYNGNLRNPGVAIARNGNVIVCWQDEVTAASTDEEDSLIDIGAGWTLLDSNGNFLTPSTPIPSLQFEQAQSSALLGFFRRDGTATPRNIAFNRN